jgi:hypothetical protein
MEISPEHIPTASPWDLLPAPTTVLTGLAAWAILSFVTGPTSSWAETAAVVPVPVSLPPAVGDRVVVRLVGGDLISGTLEVSTEAEVVIVRKF